MIAGIGPEGGYVLHRSSRRMNELVELVRSGG